jgi:hypothetical protein
MERIPIPYVKGDEALADDLLLVVRLDSQSQSCVVRPKTFFQFAQDVLVHEITSSKISSIFQDSATLFQTLQSIAFEQTACFAE